MSSSVFSLESAPAPQFQVPTGSRARIGRYDAEVISSSGQDVLLRHTGTLKVGMEVVLSFYIGVTRLQSPVVVRSCHVLALGVGGGTVYETRVTVGGAGDVPEEAGIA